MGQRLTVEIKDEGKTIGVVYYHWSAYFDSTLLELKDLKDDIADAKKNGKDVILSVIKGLEKRGGGLSIENDTRAIAAERYPKQGFKVDINRNDGLFALGEKDIKDTLAVSEGYASIDISSEEVIDEVDLEVHCNLNEMPVDPFKVMSFQDLDRAVEYCQNEFFRIRNMASNGKEAK